jgi:hypothetical protein
MADHRRNITRVNKNLFQMAASVGGLARALQILMGAFVSYFGMHSVTTLVA